MSIRSKILKQAVVIVVAVFYLSACASMRELKTSPDTAPTRLPQVLSSWMPAEDFSVYQQVNARKGEESYQFETAIDVASGELRLVMLSEFGQRVATIVYNGVELDIDRAVFLSDSFDLHYVLEAIQMIYWPPEAFTDQRESGWQLVDNNSGLSRRFYYQGELAVEINYEGDCALTGMASYHHIIYDFHLKINSVIVGRAGDTDVETIDNERCPL
jgi:hypothetical protein